MNNLLEHKGYLGTVEYSAPDNVLYGKVLGINGLISYEGTCIESLRSDFEEAVNEYLDHCEKHNINPERAYKGNFNVRVSPDLHKALAAYSSRHGKTMNSTVEEAIKQFVMP